jgi:hypothetical protein
MPGSYQAQYDYQHLLVETLRRIRNRPEKLKMTLCIEGLLADWDDCAT